MLSIGTIKMIGVALCGSVAEWSKALSNGSGRPASAGDGTIPGPGLGGLAFLSS